MSVKYESRIPEISRELADRVEKGTSVGADLVVAAAKIQAPIRTGALKVAIHKEFRGDGDWAIVAGGGDVFYGHLVEHGTTHSPAHPFLVPALESQRPAIEAAVSAALKEL